MATAMEKVFNTVEIAELILTRLPPHGILKTVPAVWRTWRAHSKNPKLARLRFHKAEEDHKEEESSKFKIAATFLVRKSPINAAFSFQSCGETVRFNPFLQTEFDWGDLELLMDDD